MPNNQWITALKAWNRQNSNSGVWMIPKKGSKEYKEVLAFMGKSGNGKRQKGGFFPIPNMPIPNIMTMYNKLPFQRMMPRLGSV